MKKTVSMMICLLMLLANVLTVFAAETDAYDMPSGAMEATPEELAGADPYDPLLAVVAEGNGIVPQTLWYSLGMQYYSQQTSTSCGPACARMVLKYLTGTTYSEATIRNNTNYSSSNGTTLRSLINYIEDEQSDHNYKVYYGSSLSYIMDGFLVGIRDESAPPICGLREQTAYGFPYNGSGGHFVVIHQVASDQSAVELYDPWAGYVNDYSNKTYEVTAQNLYSAYCMVVCGVAF